RRGWSGFGTTSCSATTSSRGAAGASGASPAAPGNNASRPLPNAFRITATLALVLSFYLRLCPGGGGPARRLSHRRCDLARQRTVRDGAARRRIVEQHWQRVARRLRHTHVAGDDGLEDLVAEVRAHLLLHLSRESVAAVVHREHEALEREARIQRLAH